nr:hypothetical protein Iba_chr01aCG6880 [Ipomoea batatas]
MVAVTASTEERTTSAERRKRSTRKWSPQICGGKASRVCGRSAEERLAGSAEGRDGMAAVAASTEERTASAERRKRSTRKWSPQICGGKPGRKTNLGTGAWRRNRQVVVVLGLMRCPINSGSNTGGGLAFLGLLASSWETAGFETSSDGLPVSLLSLSAVSFLDPDPMSEGLSSSIAHLCNTQ